MAKKLTGEALALLFILSKPVRMIAEIKIGNITNSNKIIPTDQFDIIRMPY